MSLQQRVTDDLKSAMMAREAVRTATLRMLNAALGYAQIEKKTDTLSDAEVMAVIQREAKKRRDAIEEFEKGGRAEMAANERAELEVLAGFLPKALSPEELEALVRGVIAEVGATSKKEMGAVMKAAQARIDGRADGRSVSALVSRLLPGGRKALGCPLSRRPTGPRAPPRRTSSRRSAPRRWPRVPADRPSGSSSTGLATATPG